MITTSNEMKARAAVEQVRLWGQGIDHEADLLIDAGAEFFKELGKASDAIAKIRSAEHGVWLFRADEYGQVCEMLARWISTSRTPATPATICKPSTRPCGRAPSRRRRRLRDARCYIRQL